MNHIIPFEFESRQVRTVVIQGEPWFVAKDVCEILSYVNHNAAISRHCRGVAKQYPLMTAGGMQNVRVIREPDLYRLIMGSTLESAERFEAWVYEEVLPTIRKTGGVYMTAQKAEEILADPDVIIGLAMQVKQFKAERDEAIRTKAQ